jgi:tetratricopeptide (TPR) repeat protein
VLHAHFGTEGILALPLARHLGIPLVTSFYGYDAGSLPRNSEWRRAFSCLFAQGTLFLAEGPALAQSLERLGCPRDRIRLMPIPVLLPARLPRHDSKQIPQILICGRLVEKKGVDDSLRAIAALRRLGPRAFECVVVGDGPEREALCALSRTLALDDCVRFAGAVPPATLRQMLARSALVLQMSRFAADGDCEGGSPVVLSEAMAWGVPCVATRHCDIPFLIRDGETGRLVDSGDHCAAAARLAELLADQRLRQEMGRSGRRKALNELSLKSAGERLSRIYHEAIHIFPSANKKTGSSRLLFPQGPDLIFDLRVRGRDDAGLHRMLRSLPARDRLRGRILHALGKLHWERRQYADAAECFRRWGRACPDEIEADLEEGCALLAASLSPRRALSALVRFVERHATRTYAIDVVKGRFHELGTTQPLINALMRRVTPPVEWLSAETGLLWNAVQADRGKDSLPALRQSLRFLVARSFKELLPAGKRSGKTDGRIELILVDLLAVARELGYARSDLRIREAFNPCEPMHDFSRYRLASLFEKGTGEEKAWAAQAFARLAAAPRADVNLRAGANYHLACILESAGQLSAALRRVRQCLVLNSSHGAALALLQRLQFRG